MRPRRHCRTRAAGLVFAHAIDIGAVEPLLLCEVLEGLAVISARAASRRVLRRMPHPDIARSIDEQRAGWVPGGPGPLLGFLLPPPNYLAVCVVGETVPGDHLRMIVGTNADAVVAAIEQRIAELGSG